MTLDGLTLHFIVNEINHMAVGCKIDKIYQPRPDTIVLGLRAPSKNIRLLICAGAFDSRMHITEQKYENPKSPPMFCMFLRKHITSARIVRVEQTGLERIVNITLEARDELGIPVQLTLIAELMGKYSNVILIEHSGLIMDSLRHVTRSISRVRCVLPSITYETPQSAKLNPLTVSEATLTEMLRKRGVRSVKEHLVHILQGVSGPTADEILYRYMPSGYEPQPKEAEKLAAQILSFFKDSNPIQPTLYLDRLGTPQFFSPYRYGSIHSEKAEAFGSANELADAFYHRLHEIRLVDGKRQALHKRVQKQIEKLTATLQKQMVSLENAKKADKYKNAGDIITANIYRIQKGAEILAAEDFTTGEALTIRLDPRLSPSANAQKNYKRYNKLKSGFDITLKRIHDNKKEIAFLESVQVSLDSSKNLIELFEIEYELGKAGYMPADAVKSIKSTEKPSSPYRLISSDGYIILAGKNNRQNDILTMKTAEADDIWLHTKDIPGSHVIISGAHGHVSDTALFEAASIAATLSKAKGAVKVSVDYTQRKNVRKPNGAKPGMVVYEGYNTILVNPDHVLFEKLLTNS